MEIKIPSLECTGILLFHLKCEVAVKRAAESGFIIIFIFLVLEIKIPSVECADILLLHLV